MANSSLFANIVPVSVVTYVKKHIRSKSIVMPNNDFTPGNIFHRTNTWKSHDWKEVKSHVCVAM